MRIKSITIATDGRWGFKSGYFSDEYEEAYYKNGYRHRVDGPALRLKNSNCCYWYINGYRIQEFGASKRCLGDLSAAEKLKFEFYKLKYRN